MVSEARSRVCSDSGTDIATTGHHTHPLQYPSAISQEGQIRSCQQQVYRFQLLCGIQLLIALYYDEKFYLNRTQHNTSMKVNYEKICEATGSQKYSSTTPI